MDINKVSRAQQTVCVSLSLLVICLLQGCATQGYETVPRSTAGKIQQVTTGTVVSARPVVIEGDATYLGQSSGAIMGSAIGQTAGDGTGRLIAAAGGAVVGSIVGGMVEKELSQKQAQELTVSLDDGGTVVVVQERKNVGFVEGDRVSVAHAVSGEAHISHAHYESEGIY